MSYTYTIYLLAIFLLVAIVRNISAFPDQGKWDYIMSQVCFTETIFFYINFINVSFV